MSGPLLSSLRALMALPGLPYKQKRFVIVTLLELLKSLSVDAKDETCRMILTRSDKFKHHRNYRTEYNYGHYLELIGYTPVEGGYYMTDEGMQGVTANYNFLKDFYKLAIGDEARIRQQNAATDFFGRGRRG